MRWLSIRRESRSHDHSSGGSTCAACSRLTSTGGGSPTSVATRSKYSVIDVELPSVTL